jgi:hypothetical protein
MRNHTLIWSSFLLLTISCISPNNPKESIRPQDYFPLHVGAWWSYLMVDTKYSRGWIYSFDTTYEYTFTVSDSFIENGMIKYHVFPSIWYFTQNNDAIIYGDTSGGGILIIKNGATVGSTWRGAYGWWGESSIVKDLQAMLLKVYDTTLFSGRKKAIDILLTISSTETLFGNTTTSSDTSLWTFAEQIGLIRREAYTFSNGKKVIANAQYLTQVRQP